ncbi:MAG: hypothetical protein MUP22_09210, partial [Desulfobacterales bacterium]|nr:hypothetical protein [Desulfobacterales bacterium]
KDYKDEYMLKIRGVVVPRTWDENGKVVAITILTHDEDEYHVENDGRGKELKIFIRENVEVLGSVKPQEGIKVIQVKKFNLLRINRHGFQFGD